MCQFRLAWTATLCDRTSGLARFAEAVSREDVLLDQAALLIGAWDYPTRDIDRYRDRLDAIAAEVVPGVSRASGGIGRARAISDHLFDRLGFCGNTYDYYDPRNSFLPEVLRRRLGIPITLTLVYKAVAERVGLRVEGVNAPGHILARVYDHSGPILVDPFFRGQMLTPEEALERLAQITGRTIPPDTRLLRSATNAQWLARMIANLQSIFSTTDQHQDLAAMNELQKLLSQING